ncbi:MAG: WXG100 family type VII secretion target [Dietzia sp.]
MSYSVGDVRRWEIAALTGAADAVTSRVGDATEARRGLVGGGEGLYEGWDGRAADAVLGAVESEKAHVTRLADGLEELADALARAHNALGPAVRAVRDRISEAEAAGLVVTDVSVEPAAGHGAPGTGVAVEQATVDLHAEAIGAALVTVRSLDEHYGREIDDIAARLHSAIPPEVDRSPIPGPHDPWPGRGVDAITGAMSGGYPARADELDPATRGRHTRNPAPDDFGRAASSGLRWVGRIAGVAGGGLTVYDASEPMRRGRPRLARRSLRPALR